MSKLTVTLYKPDGSEIVFSDVSHASMDKEEGYLVISPNDKETATRGVAVRTTLPFLMHEEVDNIQ